MCIRDRSRLEDQDKIKWVVNAMRDSARKWYNIVRDKVSTYAEFKQKFESRYWNSHTQRLLRNELEYGRFERKMGVTAENYIIQQVERAKHLTPAFSEIDIVTKLAYHFNHNIRVAVFTQGIRTVDELLILVSQSETVFDLGGWRYNPDFRRNNEGQNTRVQYHQQPDQRPSTSSTPPQTPSKPPNKTFEYKGKQNVGRPKGQGKGCLLYTSLYCNLVMVYINISKTTL